MGIKYFKVIKPMTDYRTGYSAVAGELLTDYEKRNWFRNLPDNVFEKVEYFHSETMKIMGVRYHKDFFKNNVAITANYDNN